MKQIVFIIVITISTFKCQELRDFDDSILYKIDWPGNIDLQFDQDKFEQKAITTNVREKYRCIIPVTQTRSQEQKKVDVNLSPLHFIGPIFSTQSCSYRIEAYWAYEICHGHHIKQYHEERDGKHVKLQEFYLGKWNDEKNDVLAKKLKEELESGKKFRTTKIDNINYPYLELEMNDGTDCDLNNNEPRTTKVRYVCYTHGKNEIYSLKETSSCNYEAVVLTSVLCMHPAFVPDESKENLITCLPVNNAPEKPLSWLVNEIDNMKYRYKQISSDSMTSPKLKKNNIAIIKINEKDGTVRMGIINADMTDQLSKLEAALQEEFKEIADDQQQITSSPSKKISSKFSTSPTDATPLIEFLSGKHCLTGGTGWWKYEFCYGRFVRQFHIDKTSENSLILGVFDEDLHKEWLVRHPDRRPKPKSIRTDISHFYQDGTICDKTGGKRETEVKLKCLHNSASPAQVSMYLLEPKTCHYILVVESPIICDLLQLADDDGLAPKGTFVVGQPIGNKKISNIDKNKLQETGDEVELPIDGLEVRYEND